MVSTFWDLGQRGSPASLGSRAPVSLTAPAGLRLRTPGIARRPAQARSRPLRSVSTGSLRYGYPGVTVAGSRLDNGSAHPPAPGPVWSLQASQGLWKSLPAVWDVVGGGSAKNYAP